MVFIISFSSYFIDLKIILKNEILIFILRSLYLTGAVFCAKWDKKILIGVKYEYQNNDFDRF